MAFKGNGTLKFFQRECDLLQKKFETLKLEYEDCVVDPAESSRCEHLIYRCDDLKKLLLDMFQKLKKLTKESEPVKLADFEYKKEDEIRRIIMLLSRIDNMKKILSGDLKENTTVNTLLSLGKTDPSKRKEIPDEDNEIEEEEGNEEKEHEENEEVDEESESEEEEDEDDDDDEENSQEAEEEDLEESPSSLRQFEVLCDFEGEQTGDLSIQTGDILTILKVREDGWWEGENEDGQRGMVPSTFLKAYNKPYELLGGGDGENLNQSQRKSPWKSIRRALWNTSATDVLTALGTLPSGFRESTLRKLVKDDDSYTTSNFLAPKLSQSCLGFRDLFWDLTSDKIQPQIVRIQRVITLISCRQIPLPGTGVEVQSRHIRMCLFDGAKIWSNIHTVRANWNEKSPKTWAFSHRVPPAISTLEDGECFIRYNDMTSNIGLLVELCVSYIRTRTGENGELSCGWVHIPLVDELGNILASRTYDLMILGGTPYEKGVELDPSIRQRAASKKFQGIISQNRQPRLIVKISQPTSMQRNFLDLLPDLLIGCMRYVMFIAYYRLILADALVHDRLSMESAEFIHAPLLKTFPAVIEQPDIMDALRALWLERMRREKESHKNDLHYMKKVFNQVFMECAYVLHHMANLPEYSLGDKRIEQVRKEEIIKVFERIRKEGVLTSLLSSDLEMEPFEISELSFNLFSPHCLSTS